MSIQLETQYLKGFVAPEEFASAAPQVKLAHELLHTGTGAGNDFIGWVNLPTIMTKRSLPGSRRPHSASSRIRMSLWSSALAALISARAPQWNT